MRPLFVASPMRVAWSEPAGNELRSTVTLTQVDGDPFQIIAAKTTNPALLKVEGIGTIAAPRQEFQVVLSKEARPGLYTEKVLLDLDNGGDKEQVELRVAASLR
jgi:hypothetical protein